METPTYPLAPAVEPIPGTLLDVAEMATTGIEWLDNATALFDSYNCLKFQTFIAGTDTAFTAPVAKTFQAGVPWQYGFRFGVYGGVSCRLVGNDREDMKSEVAKGFELGEHKAIERAFMEQRFAARGTAGQSSFRWAAPEDINPAGAVPLGWGLAMLEADAAAKYAGVPTIHMSRACASALVGTEALVRDGNALRTRLGSKVAAGGGYDLPNKGPDGSTAVDGTKWMYATGAVVLAKSEAQIIDVVSETANDAFVLAERAYVGAVDCYTSAIRVQVGS